MSEKFTIPTTPELLGVDAALRRAAVNARKLAEQLAEPNQKLKGAIIALEDDQRIKRALSVTSNISFYRYQISFKLLKS